MSSSHGPRRLRVVHAAELGPYRRASRDGLAQNRTMRVMEVEYLFSSQAAALARTADLDTLERLVDWFSDDADVLEAVISAPSVSAELADLAARLLLAGDEAWVRANEGGGRLLADPSPLVRALLASNPATADWVGLVLADDPDMSVRLAASASGSLKVLSTLSKDSDPLIRSSVASSAKAAITVLDDLCADLDPLVRVEAGRNVRASSYALAQLAGDLSVLVRAAVASNLACPTDALERLCLDKDPDVSATAARTLAAIDAGARPPRHTGPPSF